MFNNLKFFFNIRCCFINIFDVISTDLRLVIDLLQTNTHTPPMKTLCPCPAHQQPLNGDSVDIERLSMFLHKSGYYKNHTFCLLLSKTSKIGMCLNQIDWNTDSCQLIIWYKSFSKILSSLFCYLQMSQQFVHAFRGDNCSSTCYKEKKRGHNTSIGGLPVENCPK